MADYTPVFAPGKIVTLTAASAINGGDLVEVAASGTVQTAGATGSGLPPSMKVVGVAGNTTPANGRVTVYARGYVHESVAQGTVTAGDQVGSIQFGATAGAQVQTVALAGSPPVGQDANMARAILGIALTTATNPSKVRWMEV